MPMSYLRSEVDLFDFFIFCMGKYYVMIHMTALADAKFSICTMYMRIIMQYS